MRRRLRSVAVPINRHALPQIALDAGLVALAYFLAYQLRFDDGMPERYEQLRDHSVTIAVGGSVMVFWAFGLYRHWWRYADRSELIRVPQAVFVATLVMVGGIAILDPAYVTTPNGLAGLSPPAGVIGLFFLLALLLTLTARVLVRSFFERPAGGRAARDARSVLIVGAGDGGRLVLREIVRNPDLGLRPVGFVDDDPAKQHMKVNKMRVHGNIDRLPRILDDVEPDEVIIAIPSASGELRARVVGACRDRGVQVRTLPTVFELLQGGGRMVRQVREIQVEDVLGRDPVRMEIERVGAYLQGRCVMVTGAGGSIGSELCRQIARVHPSRLVLLDHAEDNLFTIEQELVNDRHVLTAVAVIADCKEEERMREVLAEHRPVVVFHAAAYKHVGMMESNPVEAVRNNALATRVMTRVAGDHGVETFILVSTDKAVAPATVMGASKALAEWQVEAAGHDYPATRFASVRFGNVLGSSGSVVPIFRRQIATGGPVTVTDPAMTRYFMTIPEAVQLIVHAGSLAGGGETFVLEMGEPVRIMDLAEQMIRLSGLEPGRDIAIDVVGPRPGEKLHEELFNTYERPAPTGAARILRADRPALNPAFVETTFDDIGLLVLEGDAARLAALVCELALVRVPAQAAAAVAAAPEPAADQVRLAT
ncbi:MAG: nucleoside-diphosphate sugar epimerase/dehydratase [Solirubrobacteraceae bacterium]